MQKPVLSDLPNFILKEILWDTDLDYDSYESSKAECIHDFLNGNGSLTNRERVETAYKNMSVDDVRQLIVNRLESIQNEKEALTALLGNPDPLS